MLIHIVIINACECLMHQTPHTLEAIRLLKGCLTSGFVFLRGWFLMIGSLLVFFAGGFRCCIGRVHSSRLHTRGDRCRLLFLPTHRVQVSVSDQCTNRSTFL